MANLLVVDDDIDMAEACADVIRSAGHHVRLARNGAEGLAQLQRALPDLILSDVEMPVLKGPDMAYGMFLEDAGREKIPILLSSGVQDLRLLAERMGTPYFLNKPFGAELLLCWIDRALAGGVAPKPRVARPGTDDQSRR
jgi:DNA-binding NtrC family response regulator